MTPRLLALLSLGSGPDPYAGFVRFSTLGVAAGEDLAIGSGAKIVQDTVMSQSIGYVTIAAGGQFVADDRLDTVTKVSGIANSGVLKWGTVGTPLLRNHVIELGLVTRKPGAIVGRTHNDNTSTGNDGSDANDDGGKRRGIITNNNATTSFVGYVQGDENQARLNANVLAGANDFYLDRVVWWKAGRRVMISQTKFASGGQVTQVLTLAADTAGTNHLQTVETCNSDRWGAMMYAVNGNSADGSDIGLRTTMSGEAFTLGGMRAHADQVNEIDERAYVALVDRNLTIQGANDSAWTTDRFGAVEMQMGNNSNRVMRQVAMLRFGQRGALGRYGSHSHLCNVVTSTGAIIAPGGNFASVNERCSFFDGANRARTIHSTQYAVSKNNTSYKALGHAFFLEDGAEENNTLWDDWSFDAQSPISAHALKAHDIEGGDGGASGHWWSNLNNSIKRNVGIGGVFGWWNAPSRGIEANAARVGGCLGPSSLVVIWPFWGKQNVWEDNVGFCTGNAWGKTNDFPFNNEGNTTQGKIQTTTDGIKGTDYGNPNQVSTVLTRPRGFKAGAPYSNRISDPRYLNPISADVKREHFKGQTDGGFIQAAVGVMESLNTETYRPGVTEPCQYKTDYHGSFSAIDCSFYGFSGGTPQTVGLGGESDNLSEQWSLKKNSIKGGWDEYTDGVLGFALTGFTFSNNNWKKFKSAGFFHTPSPHLIGGTLLSSLSGLAGYASPDQTINGQAVRRHYFLSGAILDYYGAFDDVPLSYYIYDIPFLTTGVPTLTTIPGDDYSKRTQTPFFAVHIYGDDTGTNQYSFNNHRLSAQRLDATTLAPIAGATWIGAGSGTTTTYVPFQHCAAAQAGWVHLDSREGALNSTRFHVIVGSMWKRVAFGDDIDHWFGLSIPWSGSVAPSTVKTGYGAITVSAAASKAALLAATATLYWQDTAANRLYVKVFVPWSATQNGPGVDNLHITVDA